MTLNLKHMTVAQYLLKLREKYKAAQGGEAGKIATWLLDRIVAGDITDLQVRTAFSLTTNQYSALKTRLTTVSNNWKAANSAQGE